MVTDRERELSQQFWARRGQGPRLRGPGRRRGWWPGLLLLALLALGLVLLLGH
ncbi:MAG: hypothetical protein ACOYLI_12355 [Synechococcus lacustris]|jgi:hypothetical protein